MKKSILIFVAIVLIILFAIALSSGGENNTVNHSYNINETETKIDNIIDSSGIDTIIDAKYYKSYYDIDRKQPIYVAYKLYKGGGPCDRATFRFKNDTKIETATTKDYAGTGFDMGHLANAEDFASDCVAGEKTFRFYNCLPQYPNLNRGVWKKWENKVREISQTDSLLVICGGKFSSEQIGNGVYVPEFCWKVVYSLSTKKVIKCLWFKNVKKNAELYFEETTLNRLEENLKFRIKFSY
jgi:endonuclease G